jgi:hypothetical protein
LVGGRDGRCTFSILSKMSPCQENQTKFLRSKWVHFISFIGLNFSDLCKTSFEKEEKFLSDFRTCSLSTGVCYLLGPGHFIWLCFSVLLADRTIKKQRQLTYTAPRHSDPCITFVLALSLILFSLNMFSSCLIFKCLYFTNDGLNFCKSFKIVYMVGIVYIKCI